MGMVVATRGAIAFADDFSIGSLAGLQWWASAQNSQLALNPDGSGAVANGDPVGFISDLSGNGYNAVMGNAVILRWRQLSADLADESDRRSLRHFVQRLDGFLELTKLSV